MLSFKEKPRKHLEAWWCLRHLCENMLSGLWKRAFKPSSSSLSVIASDTAWLREKNI